MSVMDLRGLTPAPVTAFTRDGDVDHAANAKLAQWLVSFEGVKGLVLLGHAGEGTYLTPDEQVGLISTVVEAVEGKVPIIAGITTEGDKTAAEEAKRAADAGATGALVYPSHGWLRFGFQPGAPQGRYKAIHEASGLQCILFQYPDVTKASYNLDTQLEIAGQPGVVATKNGVRNMRRWYTEIPVLREAFPDLQILSCHDEYLLPTMFDVDGLRAGYGNRAPEPLIELIAAADRADRRGQGPGLPQGPRAPRQAAAADQGRLPPRFAHGGHRRAQARAGSAGRARPRHGPPAAAAVGALGPRGDQPGAQAPRPGLTAVFRQLVECGSRREQTSRRRRLR